MSSTEIAVRENGHAIAERDVVDGWIAVASDVIKVANLIAETEFVPEEYRDSAPAVAAAILTGRELGIGPMMSLRHVQLVKGVPTLSAEYKRARVLAAGHDFEVLELTTQRCRVRGRRAGTPKWLEVTFTMDDARTAQIVKDKGAWKTRPRRMLFARAGSELCDFIFADVTNGLPTAELVAEGAVDDEFAGYNEAPAQAPPASGEQPAAKAGPRTARRRTPANSGKPVSREAAAASEPEKPAGPPLPGEEEDPGPAASDRTEAAAGPDPKGPDHGSPGTATRGKGGQLTAIWTVLRTVFEFGEDEKDQARAVCEHVIRRDLGGTTGNMSWNEASLVLDTLANWQQTAESNSEPPRNFLIALMAAEPAEEAPNG